LPVFLCGYETWSLILRNGHRLTVSENRVLRRIYEPKRGEIVDCRNLNNEELQNMYFSPNII
jgi:hypothetical protein